MYEDFYNFRAKPFQLSPDPRFFFNSQGHKRALSYLRYGLRQGEGFIIITGNVGTGKTTLVTALFKALERENVVAAQVVTTNLPADELVKVVAIAFGLETEQVSKAALLRNLETFFRTCAQEGKRVLLVVDEAQGLPKKSIEELRMLSNFQHHGRALLQTFMLGQREFRTTMRSEGFEQLRQRVIAAYHLKPLDQLETEGYVVHRLCTAGWVGNPTLDERIFEAIYEFTEGVPRRINTLCNRLFLYGAMEELKHLSLDDLRAVTLDIMEEQGATTQEISSMDKYHGSARIAVAEDHSQPQDGKKVLPDRKQAENAKYPNDKRLSDMEASMTSLANAMREEMSLLRQALINQAGKDSGEDK